MTRLTRLRCRSIGGRLLLAGCAASVVVNALASQAPRPATTGTSAAEPASKPATASRCGFIGDTLVPQLAMGVRRVDGDEIDVLELRSDPAYSAPVMVEKPLFRPFFVVASRSDSEGKPWHLLQDGYVAEKPLGWAPERHLHLMESRYAYTFARRQRQRRADLHDDSKESYDRLLAQLKGDDEGGAEAVVVKEREGAERWNPVTIDDTVPFVEIRIPPAKRDQKHPDTTPTFRFGIPVENRLVHMGAVCGGPRNDERLKELRKTFDADHGLDMLFVVDETTSMHQYNKVVADFIRSAGDVAASQQVPVRIAVCSYLDGPEGERVNIGEFNRVAAVEDVVRLVAWVSKLGELNEPPPGDYANPPERMLEGLRDALTLLPIDRQSAKFVAVVGDTGHEPTDPMKGRLLTQTADLIERTGARVYFMHVGSQKVLAAPNPLDSADYRKAVQLFEDDFKALQKALVQKGLPRDRVVYQRADERNLLGALERARDAVEEEHRRLRREIARIESRSPYTEPGSKLLRTLAARGLDRNAFDDRHLQFFVPSRGWLFHPASQEQAIAEPQFRELFFLAPPEREAVKRLLDDLRARLARGESIDGDAVIGKFATDLAAVSGAPAVAGLVVKAWERMPKERRSVGVFLEDAFGLRLKAALPFPPTAYSKDLRASQEEIERMQERTSRLGEAFEAGGDTAVWFDASSLMP